MASFFWNAQTELKSGSGEEGLLPVWPSPLSIDGLLVSDGLFILESAMNQR